MPSGCTSCWEERSVTGPLRYSPAGEEGVRKAIKLINAVSIGVMAVARIVIAVAAVCEIVITPVSRQQTRRSAKDGCLWWLAPLIVLRSRSVRKHRMAH